MKIKIEKGNNFVHIFDYKTGLTINFTKDKNFNSAPKLLDVSITNFCRQDCEYCYKQSNSKGKHMSLDEYLTVLREAKICKVDQIALGGGNPNEHPKFIEILKQTSDSGIVVNYSTNGNGLTSDILMATKKYCGAIALSIHNDLEYYEAIVKEIIAYNIKLNLHFILSKNNLPKLIQILKNPPKWFSSLNAIIFLNYKPFIGDGNNVLKNSDLVNEFFSTIKTYKLTSIGFDTCSISYLMNNLEMPNEISEYCEAARYSAYISENLDVLPCSFYKQNYCDNLKNKSLKYIWENNCNFKKHRERILNNGCKNNCSYFEDCHGGCQIYNNNNKCCINDK